MERIPPVADVGTGGQGQQLLVAGKGQVALDGRLRLHGIAKVNHRLLFGKVGPGVIKARVGTENCKWFVGIDAVKGVNDNLRIEKKLHIEEFVTLLNIVPLVILWP